MGANEILSISIWNLLQRLKIYTSNEIQILMLSKRRLIAVGNRLQWQKRRRKHGLKNSAAHCQRIRDMLSYAFSLKKKSNLPKRSKWQSKQKRKGGMVIGISGLRGVGINY